MLMTIFLKIPVHGLKRLNAWTIKRIFIAYEICRARMHSKNKLKIVFSNKPDWEHAITQGYKFTQHDVTFETLSPDKLTKSDLVIPLTIPDLKNLNASRDLTKHNPIPIPSLESILLCDDKYLTNQFLIENGFEMFIPKMHKPAYPYILKKRIDEWGENSHIVRNAQQEKLLASKICHPDYFCQELVTGTAEYATHIIIKNKRATCAINIKYVFEINTPIKGKDKPVYMRICRNPYIDIFESILNRIDFEGLCCVNYKVQDQQPKILEINPRFGGSLGPYIFSFMRKIT